MLLLPKELLIYGLPKSKQSRKGDPKKNKRYHVLLQNHTNPLVPLYFKFFESIAAKLNGFLRRFQSDAPMVPFLVNTLEEITREFCSKFILDEVMGNSTNTIQLIKMVKLEKLVSSHHFTANQADNAKSQYASFLQTTVNRNHSTFNDFNVDESRLDEFLMSYLESCSRFRQLTEIAKFIMVLSHGQSALERGFSTNKNLLVENLQEKSIECQRIVVDYMRSNGFQAY